MKTMDSLFAENEAFAAFLTTLLSKALRVARSDSLSAACILCAWASPGSEKEDVPREH